MEGCIFSLVIATYRTISIVVSVRAWSRLEVLTVKNGKINILFLLFKVGISYRWAGIASTLRDKT